MKSSPDLAAVATGRLESPPESWQIKRLGELLREVDVRAASIPEEEAAALEVLSLTKNNGLIPQTQRFAKRIATADTRKYKVVRFGQIVYNPYVIWEGAVHALRKPSAGLVSPVYPVWETIDTDPVFLDYLLRTPQLIASYNRLCSGAVNRRRSIRTAAFASIEVSVPALPEQRAIAEVLRTVQRAQEESKQMIAATRQLKQSLLQHLFTYGPVPFEVADKVPLKDSEAGSVPDHWAHARLDSVFALTSGKTRPPELQDKPQLAFRFPVYGGNGIMGYASTSLIAFPTVILGRVGEYCGAVHVSHGASWVSDNALYAKTFFRDMHLGFLGSALARLNLNRHSHKSSQPLITQSIVYAQSIPLPSPAEQSQIAACLSAVDRKTAAEESRRLGLESLFQSLLHNLMLGRLRVNTFANELFSHPVA
jgi:type I restriction enzyme, S subunit